MRIAVCLSGQPRAIRATHESIRHYYSSHQVDYFCHAWDYNTWKLRHSHTPMQAVPVPPEDLGLIRSTFAPIQFEIGSAPDGPVHSYRSMFESMARANQLRRHHELLYGFEYDWVIRARYDLAFPPGRQFRPKHHPLERALCVRYPSRLPDEYRRISISDVHFYGDSWGMDIASDCYGVLVGRVSPTPVDEETKLGPGVILADHITRSNLIHTGVDTEEVIVRYESQHLDMVRDWEEVHRIHWSYY